jgi:urea transport system permease protein
VRMAIKPVVDLLKNRANLTSDSPDFRRSAASDLGASGRAEAIPFLRQAAEKEAVWWVKHSMEEAANFLELRSADPAVQLAAVTQLGKLRSSNSVPLLKELIEAGQGAEATDQQKALAEAATAAVAQVESWGWWANIMETIFRGISLSSILLIMSLGLAIVFGLMGVINMAHGELMMIGAYATFVTQQAFVAWFSPEVFDWYFPVALPVAFVAAAGAGWVLEATVIRFLYGRLLETLLATWGVSLILMQAARVYFGDLTAVIAPHRCAGASKRWSGCTCPTIGFSSSFYRSCASWRFIICCFGRTWACGCGRSPRIGT